MNDNHDDRDEELDEDEAGEEADTSPDTSEAAPGDADESPVMPLPRAKPRAAVAAGPISPFGAVPRAATAWGIRKKPDVGGAWGRELEWAGPGDTLAVREWPLEELSEAEIRRRWGPGIYQVHWFKTTDTGGRGHLSYGREVTVLPAIAPSSPAPASPPAGVSALAEALQMMQILDQQSADRRAAITAEANQQIAGMAQLATIMQRNAGGGGGIDAATLQTILRENREATVAAVREVVGADDGDEDEGAAGVAGAAAAAAAPFVKGKGTLAQLLNFATANPAAAAKIAETALPIAASALGKLAEVFAPKAPSSPPPPPPAAVAPVHALPRAVPMPPKPPEPPSPAKVVSGLSASSGLSSVAPSPPAPEPAT